MSILSGEIRKYWVPLATVRPGRLTRRYQPIQPKEKERKRKRRKKEKERIICTLQRLFEEPERREARRKDEGVTEDINISLQSEYLQGLIGTSKDGWKLYGAPIQPLVDQKTANIVLNQLTTRKDIKEIRVIGKSREGERKIERVANKVKQHINQIDRDIEKSNWFIPPFWLEQREIKEILKQKQEEQTGK